MDKFTKGRTYIVCGNAPVKYLVQQTGLKSWRAMILTHVVSNDVGWGHAVVEGNATTLYQKLDSLCGTIDVRGYSTHNTLRKALFNILKFGRFEE